MTCKVVILYRASRTLSNSLWRVDNVDIHLLLLDSRTRASECFLFLKQKQLLTLLLLVSQHVRCMYTYCTTTLSSPSVVWVESSQRRAVTQVAAAAHTSVILLLTIIFKVEQIKNVIQQQVFMDDETSHETSATTWVKLCPATDYFVVNCMKYVVNSNT